MNELYKKYRPKNLRRVLGQDDTVKMLSDMLESNRLPHSILFTGPSGCGKTTIARILRKRLKCSDADFAEINCANFRGIDSIRQIDRRKSIAPIRGNCRIWLIDEVHEMTKSAQEAFLKLLEDTPSHVYFFLATTNPEKLIKAIRTRCTDVKVKALTPKTMEALLKTTAKKEGIALDDEVSDKIVNVAEGSARKALVLLNQIIGIDDTDDQLATIENNDSEAQAIELLRELMKSRPQWGAVTKLIKAIDAEPESIRRAALGYYANVALGGGKASARAVDLIECFRDNYFDSGKAGLVASCWEAIYGNGE